MTESQTMQTKSETETCSSVSSDLAPGDQAETTETTETTASEPATDIQAQIDTALAKQQADFAAQLEQATGFRDFETLNEANLKDQGKFESLATSYKEKYEHAQIDFAIMAAASEAVSPAFLKDYLAPRAVCDDNGNVTIDGRPVAEAVSNLLTEHPFLAKPQGGPGSGAPSKSNASASAETLSRAEFERLPADAGARFISNGGKVRD